MGWKKLIMGEKMPSKDDPEYRERYEKEVNAGRRVARWLKIDRAAAAVQRFADRWPRVFLAIVFGTVVFCFALNAYRLVQVSMHAYDPPTAVEKQERKYHRKKSNNQHKTTDNEHTERD